MWVGEVGKLMGTVGIASEGCWASDLGVAEVGQRSESTGYHRRRLPEYGRHQASVVGDRGVSDDVQIRRYEVDPGVWGSVERRRSPVSSFRWSASVGKGRRRSEKHWLGRRSSMMTDDSSVDG